MNTGISSKYLFNTQLLITECWTLRIGWTLDILKFKMLFYNLLFFLGFFVKNFIINFYS